MLFLLGNDCPPDLFRRWILSSQFWELRSSLKKEQDKWISSSTIDISFRVHITSGTRLIENISGVFPRLERRIYTYLVCCCQRAIAMIDIPFRVSITKRTRFIENISGVFPHLERRIYTSCLLLPAHFCYDRY